MEATLSQTKSSARPRIAIFASLLPIWLFSLAVSIEGFPRPPIPGWLGIGAFYAAFPVSIWLLWNIW